MTKKVSKSNLICLFPSKPRASRGRAPQSNSSDALEWHALNAYLETAPWGSALFGAPMDRVVEAKCIKAVKLALASDDLKKIAISVKHLFYLYCEFHIENALGAGVWSVEAAAAAYGEISAEVGEELAMLAVECEYRGKEDIALAMQEESLRIFETAGTTKRALEAFEMAICSAADRGQNDKVQYYARRGIELVKKRCVKGSKLYTENLEYFEQMLESTVEESASRKSNEKLPQGFLNALKNALKS